MVSHPGVVDKISPTREHSTGQKIIAAATSTPKRVSLECGGKSPHIGYKMRGIGRENGLEALREFVEVKTVVIDLSQAPAEDPFATSYVLRSALSPTNPLLALASCQWT